MSHRYERRPATISVPVAYVCDLCGDEEPGEGHPVAFKSAGGGRHLCPACFPRWQDHVDTCARYWDERREAMSEFGCRWDEQHPEPVWVWPSREGA